MISIDNIIYICYNKKKRKSIRLTRIGERKRLSKSFGQKENKKKEEWRDIKGYEGLYQVSNIGRVKSLERIFIDKRGHRQHIL